MSVTSDMKIKLTSNDAILNSLINLHLALSGLLFMWVDGGKLEDHIADLLIGDIIGHMHQ